jgi:MshEN domain
VSVEFGRRLLLSGAVGQPEIQAALFRHLGTGTPFVRALIEIGGISERAIEEELMRSSVPVLDIVVPLPSLVDELPEGLCRRLLAVPIRRDARSGLVDVAVVDPYDSHAAEEIAFHLKSEVRILRARLSVVDEALARIDQGVYSDKVIVRKSEPPAPAAAAARSPSGPPIPLVRKSTRAGEGFVGGRSVPASDDDETIEVLGVRDIVEEMDGDAALTDDLGQPVMPLTPKVPRAPSVPSFVKDEP